MDDLVLISLMRRGRSVLLAGATALTLTAACSAGPTAAPVEEGDRPTPSSTSSLPSVFYVDPASPAAEQAARWQAEGQTEEAAELRKISEQPAAKWLTGGPAPVRDTVAGLVEQAAVAGQTPVLVVHNIPQRDCGRRGAQGARDGSAYRGWIRELVAGIGGRPAIVIIEPGAVADTVDGCVRNITERYELLRHAIAMIKETGSTRVYLDAGHPGWVKDVETLAGALKRAGIEAADGFALNVANFVRTADNVTYGHRISDALGGDTTFVIDTSRNGNGPYPAESVDGAKSFCNPPGRALGEFPTEQPDLPRVDALLWIKYPGESDGACRPGEPEAGRWWPEYALELARQAAPSR